MLLLNCFSLFRCSPDPMIWPGYGTGPWFQPCSLVLPGLARSYHSSDKISITRDPGAGYGFTRKAARSMKCRHTTRSKKLSMSTCRKSVSTTNSRYFRAWTRLARPTFWRSRLNQRSRRASHKGRARLASISHGYSVNSPITKRYRVANAGIIAVRSQYTLPAASIDDSSFHLFSRGSTW